MDALSLMMKLLGLLTGLAMAEPELPPVHVSFYPFDALRVDAVAGTLSLCDAGMCTNLSLQAPDFSMVNTAPTGEPTLHSLIAYADEPTLLLETFVSLEKAKGHLLYYAYLPEDGVVCVQSIRNMAEEPLPTEQVCADVMKALRI